MNTQRKTFASIGILLLAATASMAQQVKTDYDHNADFTQYKTYSWENVQTQDPLWVDRIKGAVNAALAAKGWTQHRHAESNSSGPEDSSRASFVAKAASGSIGGDPVRLHGYYFRVLRSGPTKGKTAGGFALIAYPAEYRSSGVMTFIVIKNGVVYEKDLGVITSAVASTMAAFQKDATWWLADK